MDEKQKKVLKNVLFVIGIILLLIGVIKVSFIGYYNSEIPLYLGILVAAIISLYVSHRISYKLKVKEADEEAD